MTRARIFTPSAQYAYLLVTIGLVIPIIAGVALGPSLISLYYERVEGPELQQAFGFAAAHVTIRSPEGDIEVLAITSVIPGGAMARAGVLPGDFPVGYQHGALDFYRDLEAARAGQKVRLRLAHADFAARTLDERHATRIVELVMP